MAAEVGRLGLRPGELVEVRSKEEILATLGPDATRDGLPFMPEMLRFCGQRFRIHKPSRQDLRHRRQDGWTARLYDTVHLRDLRCDGSAHGGCEAGCLMFWREAWLKRVDADPISTTGAGQPARGCDGPVYRARCRACGGRRCRPADLPLSDHAAESLHGTAEVVGRPPVCA